MMQKNIGTADRIIRFTLAFLLGGLAFQFKSWLLGVMALFTLYEALASWCLLYHLIGKNSCFLPTKPEGK
ncbi:Uncharacterized protein NEOC95_002246 [Neochlamydia sp. AcF95]|nr:Uncharacterized protein [Neochlamydia sp. AcF95]